MSWLRLESNFVNHYKITRLADQLKTHREGGRSVSVGEAGWFVTRALSWFSQFCPTGQVAGHHRQSDADALERFCDWEGERGRLFAGFITVGLIDNEDEGGFGYHDWPEYQGKVSASAEKERKRKADYRARKAAEKALSRGTTGGTNAGTDAGRPALRDVTGRDETERSSSYEDDGATPPSPGTQFFDWFQERRAEGGWAHERPPPRDEIDEFFTSVSKQLPDTPEGTREALEVASQGYAKDPYWVRRALPWAGFVEQWSRHVWSPKTKAEQQAMPLGVLGAVGK